MGAHATDPPNHGTVISAESLQLWGIWAPSLTAMEHCRSDAGAVDLPTWLWGDVSGCRCCSRPLRLMCHQCWGRWGSPLVGCRCCRLVWWDGRRWGGRCPSTWGRRTACSGRGDPWGCYTVCVTTACTWRIGWSCFQHHFCIRHRETSQCLSARPAQHRRSGTSSSACSLRGPSSPWLPSMPSACCCTAQASLLWSPGWFRIFWIFCSTWSCKFWA